MSPTNAVALMAKLADQRSRPVGQGYVAERHPLMPDLILVWAPCGCVWVHASGGSFLTTCTSWNCDLNWTEIHRAFAALQNLERTGIPEEQPVQEQTAIVRVEGTPIAPTDGDEKAISNMVSEGGPGA